MQEVSAFAIEWSGALETSVPGLTVDLQVVVSIAGVSAALLQASRPERLQPLLKLELQEAAAAHLKLIHPVRFYRDFYNNSERSGVESELVERIRGRLGNLGVVVTNVIAKPLEPPLVTRLRLLQGKPTRFGLAIYSIHTNSMLDVSGSFQVEGVHADGWYLFQTHQRDLDDIRSLLEDHLTATLGAVRLETFITDLRTQALFREKVTSVAEEFLRSELGLRIDISRLLVAIRDKSPATDADSRHSSFNSRTVPDAATDESNYNKSVFINCPFDSTYAPMFEGILFAIYSLGFQPRCALERFDSGEGRLPKLIALIDASRFSIHDLSRTELDDVNQLPRFNMPFELGLDMALKSSRNKHRRKSFLIFDSERYRYQKYISDIAGHDIASHHDDPGTAIKEVRNWLRAATNLTSMPGGDALVERHRIFANDLPRVRSELGLDKHGNLSFPDLSQAMLFWLREAS